MTAFMDTTVPLHGRGAESAIQRACVAILNLAAGAAGTCTASAEVLQEVFHVVLRRTGSAATARQAVLHTDNVLSGEIAGVLRTDVLVASALVVPVALSGRDRLHIAVMQRLGISDIITTDRGFDGINGIRRLDPLDLAMWRDSVFAY